MGEKRANNASNGNKNKRAKYKLSNGMLDPGTSGIYASCIRRKERFAAQELKLLFEEKLEEYYSEELKEMSKEEGDDESVGEKEELSIEDQIKQELLEIKKPKTTGNNGKSKKEILQFIDIGCECMLFCKTRKPIEPEKFIRRIIDDLSDPNVLEKRTRYIQKLTPITNSCNATMEQFIKLLDEVLKPHFFSDEVKKDYTFSVELSRRNFNTIERDDIIDQVVKQVTADPKHNHTVNLKQYDKLIIVECFKSNMGVSVVDGDYKKCKKYNIQQIFESKFNDKKEQEDKLKEEK